MKNVHITLSIPEDLKSLLYSTVEKGSISRFVVEVLEKTLKKKKDDLAVAYRESAKDLGQLEGIKDWKGLEQEDFQGVEWDE